MGAAGAGEEDLDFSYLLIVPTPLLGFSVQSTEKTEGEAKGVKISEHSDVSFKWKQTPLSNLEVHAQ